MTLRKLLAPLLAVALCWPAAASAADTELRLAASASHGVAGGLALDLDARTHIADALSRIDQVRFGGALNLALAPGITVGAGYDYSRYFPEGRAGYHAHRTIEQLGYALATLGGARFDGRTRLEQTMLDSGERTRHRLRQRLRLTVPLADHGRLRGIAYGEAYAALRDRPGVPSGLEQWRAYAGLSLPLAGAASLQAGYLHMVSLPGPDRATRAIELNLSTRF